MAEPKKSAASHDGTLSVEDIAALVGIVSEKGIEEMEFERGDTRLRIVARRAAPAPVFVQSSPAQMMSSPAPVAAPVAAAPSAPVEAVPAKPAEDDPKWRKVPSPMVGTFYRSPGPDSPSFVNVGDRVEENTVLCIIEAMKLMNEIKAEMRGTVRRILVENAQTVEYGQAIFVIEPN